MKTKPHPLEAFHKIRKEVSEGETKNPRSYTLDLTDTDGGLNFEKLRSVLKTFDIYMYGSDKEEHVYFFTNYTLHKDDLTRLSKEHEEEKSDEGDDERASE